MAHMNAFVLVGANAGPDMKDQIIEQEAKIHRLTAPLRGLLRFRPRLLFPKRAAFWWQLRVFADVGAV